VHGAEHGGAALANILAKLGIRSRTEVAVWVVQQKPQVLTE
jgi:DNA-binding NarL/FixJ family response regulator